MRDCTSKRIYNCGKDFANVAKKSSWLNLVLSHQNQTLYLNDIYFKGTASTYPIYKYLHLVSNLRGTCTFDTGDHRRKCNVKSQIYLKLGSIEISRKRWVRHEILIETNLSVSCIFVVYKASSKHEGLWENSNQLCKSETNICFQEMVERLQKELSRTRNNNCSRLH